MASWLFGFLASWLLGFLAFRLLGFSASWFLGFSASWLLGFWASGLLGFLVSWLLGFLAFRFSASGLLGFLVFCWFMRLLVAFGLFASSAFPIPLRQVAFLPFCIFSLVCAASALAFRIFGLFGYWFLDLAFRIISITTTLFESSLLRASWGGEPRYCLDCLQSNCTPI